MLNETAPPVVGQAILDEVARHLKLPTPVDAETIAETEASFRAAVSHVEAQLGLALIRRSFIWQGRLSAQSAFTLPMAPIAEITAARIIPRMGAAQDIELAKISLDQTNLRTKVVINAGWCGTVELSFVAGFGNGWADTPADLRQAVFLLSAHYFDNRHAAGNGAEIPHGVNALLASWRPLRLGFGGAQ